MGEALQIANLGGGPCVSNHVHSTVVIPLPLLCMYRITISACETFVDVLDVSDSYDENEEAALVGLSPPPPPFLLHFISLFCGKRAKHAENRRAAGERNPMLDTKTGMNRRGTELTSWTTARRDMHPRRGVLKV